MKSAAMGTRIIDTSKHIFSCSSPEGSARIPEELGKLGEVRSGAF